ncbi:MAG: nucleotide exchange factor GrpE [Lachnospiraceae bacterium]
MISEHFWSNVYICIKELLGTQWDSSVVLGVPVSMVKGKAIMEIPMTRAGFIVRRIVKNSALCLLYTLGCEKLFSKIRKTLVINLDNGYFDGAIIETGEDVVEVLSTGTASYKNETMTSLLKKLISHLIRKAGIKKTEIDCIHIYKFDDEHLDFDFVEEFTCPVLIFRDGKVRGAKGACLQHGKLCGFSEMSFLLILLTIDEAISVGIESEKRNRVMLLEVDCTIPTREILALKERKELLENLNNKANIMIHIGEYCYRLPVEKGWEKDFSALEIMCDVSPEMDIEIVVRNTNLGLKKTYYPLEELEIEKLSEESKDSGKPLCLLNSLMIPISMIENKVYSWRKVDISQPLNKGIIQIHKQCIDFLKKNNMVYSKGENTISLSENVNKTRFKSVDRIPLEMLQDEKTIISEILQILDSFDYAIKYMKNVKENSFFRKAYRLMLVTLEKNGITCIETKNAKYNPMLHEAVEHVTDPVKEDNIIVDEFQKGYFYKGKVFRFSKVKVAN